MAGVLAGILVACLTIPTSGAAQQPESANIAPPSAPSAITPAPNATSDTAPVFVDLIPLVKDKYVRLIMKPEKPVSFTLVKSSDRLLVNFSSAVSLKTSAMAQSRFISGATLSRDQKTLILILTDDASRVRRFIGDNIAGFDIISARVFVPEISAKKEPPRSPAAPGKNFFGIPTLKPTFLSPSAKAPKPVSKPESQAVPRENEDFEEAESLVKRMQMPQKILNKITRHAIENGIQLIYPFDENVSAAVFQRHNVLWMVFNQSKELDLSEIKGIPFFEDITQMEHPYFTIVRVILNPQFIQGKLRYSTSRQKQDWVVEITEIKGTETSDALSSTEPLDVLVSATSSKPNVLVKGFDFTVPLKIVDPEVGDILVIVPVSTARTGITPVRSFVDFSLLESAQGVVLERYSDQVLHNVNTYGFEISGLNRLHLSKNVGEEDMQKAIDEKQLLETKENLPTIVPFNSVFPFKLEEEKKEKNAKADAHDPTIEKDFNKRRKLLLKAIVDAPKRQKSARREELARFLFAHQHYAEAHGVLREIQDQDPGYKNMLFVQMTMAATQYLVRQYTEAHESFQKLEAWMSDNESAEEIKLWYWASQRKSGAYRHQKATPVSIDYIESYDKFQINYPASLRYDFGLMAIEEKIQQENINAARSIFEIISFSNIPPEYVNYTKFIEGLLAFHSGRQSKAEELWSTLTTVPDDRYIRARATYELTRMQLVNGVIDVDTAVNNLERLSLVWRGDDLEIDILKLLGELQIRQKQFTKGLRTWKALVENYPGTTDAIIVAGKMKRTFSDLFEKGQAFDMKPFEALSLFFDFRELTPIGEKGDLMIRQLVQHFIDADLLDNAASVLNHQTRFRATGKQRQELALQLADLYLLNQQPDMAKVALNYIDLAQAADEVKLQYNQRVGMIHVQKNQLNEAIESVQNDHSPDAEDVRIEVFWKRNNWFGIIRIIEPRNEELAKDITIDLTKKNISDVLKIAVAYRHQGMQEQLLKLKKDFSTRIMNKKQLETFDFLTRPVVPVKHRQFDKTVQLEDIGSAMLYSIYWPEREWRNVIATVAPEAERLMNAPEITLEEQKEILMLGVAYAMLAKDDEKIQRAYNLLQRDFRSVSVNKDTIEIFSIFDDPVMPIEEDSIFDNAVPLSDLMPFIEAYQAATKISELNPKVRELLAK